MRLLNTTTLKLEEFPGNRIPKYAILSHTWGNEEVLFSDMKKHHVRQHDTKKKGYEKIENACRKAAGKGYEYVWIDTCCIDKSSSAELSEAINAMFNWYGRSGACFVYLSDLKAKDPKAENTLDTLDGLENCLWFSRGWTLQELIAPEEIIFFDESWMARGTKTELVERLSHITGIGKDILLHRQPLSAVSVAQKMSWAAGRKTTRIEDVAYCLLGIFGVHLSFVYGEEHRAFRRLQEAIILSVPDLSLFAWQLELPPSESGSAGALQFGSISTKQSREYCGLFAKSPAEFKQCRSYIMRKPFSRHELLPLNGSIMAKMQVLIETVPMEGGYRYLLPLDCFPESEPDVTLCVRIRKYGCNEFVRQGPYCLAKFNRPLLNPIVTTSRYLLPQMPVQESHSYIQETANLDFIGQSRSYAIQIMLPEKMWVHMLDPSPNTRFDGEDRVFYLTGHNTEYDSAMVRLRGGVVSDFGEPVEVDFECVFCALGWSSTDDAKMPECTVIDYNNFAAESVFRAEVSGWDFFRNYFRERLAYHRIPRASFAIVQGRKSPIRVSFTASLVADGNICRNRFWRVWFFYESCEGEVLGEKKNIRWPCKL